MEKQLDWKEEDGEKATLFWYVHKKSFFYLLTPLFRYLGPNLADPSTILTCKEFQPIWHSGWNFKLITEGKVSWTFPFAWQSLIELCFNKSVHYVQINVAVQEILGKLLIKYFQGSRQDGTETSTDSPQVGSRSYSEDWRKYLPIGI